MTREEATKQFYAGLAAELSIGTQVNSYVWCRAIVSGLERIGVLKFGAPQSDRDAAIQYLSCKGFPNSAPMFLAELDGGGFKVVRK